ncbi:hypothetical protein ACFC80_02060 [Enterococcus casseliflavus]|uniref:hypothetical protein n=1 Tax=Enterococcus casseliflavus TaxID=37734 RepID=UPI0039A63B10
MNDGSVIIDVEFNTDKARKQYQDFGNEAAQQLDNKIGKSKAFNSLSEQSVEFAKKASLSILAVGTAVAGFSIKAAGDMQAMDAQFSQVFGNLEKDAQSSIDSISKETNILPNRLKPAFTSMAAFAKTSGMDTAESLDLTTRATKAAADSAAFYDKSIGEVSESLQQYLKGNYENDAALGISSTETTRNAAANKLYGKSFNDLSEAQKQLTLLQMVEDGNKLSGALGQAAREGGGLENVIGNMKQAITDLGAAFGAPLLDPFLAIVQKISGAMAKLAEVFRENPALVYVVVGAITTLAAAFGAVWLKAVGFAKIGSMISTALSVLASPIFLVIAAIGALVTAFIYFYNTSDTFREKVNGAVKTLQSFMAPVGDVIEGIKLLAQAFKAIVFNDFSVSLSDLHDQFVKLFPESLWNGMTSFAQSTKGIVQGISTLAQAFKAIALDDFSVSVTNLKTDFLEVFPESLWNGMTKIALGIRSLINGFKSGEKSIDPFGIALKILQSVFLGLLGPIGLFIKGFELIAKALGGGDVSKGIDKIVDAFDSLASGLQSNGPKVGKSAGKAIEGILTAIAGALPGIISGGLQIVAAIVSGIAQGLPSLAMSASQLIMAFTAAMLILVPQIALSATAIIVALLAALTAGLPQIIVAGGSLILALLEGITQQLPALIESAATLIVTWLTSLTSHLPEIITAGMSLLVAVIQGITEKLPDLVFAVANLIVAFLTALAEQMPNIVIAGANLLINFLVGLASKMPDIVASALNLVIQFINGLASKAGDVVTAGVNLIVSILNGIANNIDRIVTAGMNIVDATVEGVINAQDRLFNAAIRLVNGMADNIRNHRDEMISAGKNLLSAIIEGIPGSGLVSAGYDLIMGLAQGIGNAASEAVTAARNVASSILDKVTGFFDINSPSRVMRDQVGKYLPEGIAVGIDKGGKSALNSMDRLSQDLLDAASNEFTGKIPAIDALINGVLSPELASGISKSSSFGSSSGSITNNHTSSPVTINNQGLLDGAIFHVREEADIQKVAKEINDLTTKEAGNKGFRRMK